MQNPCTRTICFHWHLSLQSIHMCQCKEKQIIGLNGYSPAHRSVVVSWMYYFFFFTFIYHLYYHQSVTWPTTFYFFIVHVTLLSSDSFWLDSSTLLWLSTRIPLFCDLLSKWHYCPSDVYCTSDSIVLVVYKYGRLWSLRPQTWLLVSYGTLNTDHSYSLSPLRSSLPLSQYSL